MSVLDRNRTPASGAIRDFDFPEMGRRDLTNDIDLRVSRLSRLPLVSVNLFVRAGESALTPDVAGLSVLAGDAIEGGTRKRSGTELAEASERIGVRMGATTGWEGTSFSMSCLAERLEEGLDLLAEAILEPDFPEDEVARVRDQQLASIRARAMDPGSIASEHALFRYFAEGTPYARPQSGTEASVSALGRDHLRGYADAHYRPGGAGLIVVGDVSGDEVRDLAERRLGSWTGTPPAGDDFEVRPRETERRVWIVDRPGAVQTEIRVGHVGVARSTPDYFPLNIANLLFGGSFTSRLNLNLREKHGFTYGIRSRFGFRSRPGSFQVSTSVGTEVTAGAVTEIFRELDGLVSGGPTDEEVAASRDYAAGIFGLQLETAGQIAARISQMVVYGLADDYYARYRDMMRAVTTDEVAEAVRRHMRPHEAQVILVGDAEAIQGSVQELGLGPIEVIPAD